MPWTIKQDIHLRLLSGGSTASFDGQLRNGCWHFFGRLNGLFLHLRMEHSFSADLTLPIMQASESILSNSLVARYKKATALFKQTFCSQNRLFSRQIIVDMLDLEEKRVSFFENNTLRVKASLAQSQLTT